MEIDVGLLHIWQQSDWIKRSVAILLLLMSLACWMVIVLKLLDLRQHRLQAQRVEGFWHCPDFAEGVSQLGPGPDNPFYLLALQGREASGHIRHLDGAAQRQLHDSLDASDWITRALRSSIDDTATRLQSGLVILASVGSTAPYIGLFGTVWGIYHALLGIGAAGNASIAQVAAPIGAALILTALGLLVAIPAVLGYNGLLRANKRLLHQINRFGTDLHAYFVTGARVGAATASASAGKVLPIKQA